MEPDFSIIIPCYNNLFLLKRALFSVLKQKDVSFEVIICDDTKTCLIADFINELHIENIKYYHNNPRLGAVNNWNYGLSKANGKYITLLHHDESFKDELHLKKCAEQFNKGYNIIVSNIEIHLYNGTRKTLCNSYIKYFIIKHPSLLFAVNLIGPCATICFRRNLKVEFNPKLVWLVDVDWYYKILKNNKIIYLKSLFISSLHGHNEQISLNIDIKESEKKDIFLLKKTYKRNIFILLSLYLRKFLFYIKNK